MAKRVSIVRPRAERIDDAQLELPKMPRDWRLTIAAVCIGVSLAGLVMGVVLALVWP